MVLKKDLDGYKNIDKKISALKLMIQKRQCEIVHDSVKGSYIDYPYTSHSVSIYGVRPDTDRMIRKWKSEIIALEAKKEEVCNYVDAIKNSRIQTIMFYHVLNGMDWDEVAAALGHHDSKDALRMAYTRETKKLK